MVLQLIIQQEQQVAISINQLVMPQLLRQQTMVSLKQLLAVIHYQLLVLLVILQDLLVQDYQTIINSMVVSKTISQIMTP